MELSEYQERSTTAKVSRDDQGVLTITMHSKGGSLWWGGRPHRELAELFAAIASDRENRVVVITGTGSSFIEMPSDGGIGALARGSISATDWDRTIWEGNRLVNNLLDIEVPMIAAVNGPVEVHSELAVLCDIVLCTDDTYFADLAHFPNGLVPGDSMQVIWPLLLGPNRGRYFLLTGERLTAADAKALGVVGEVLGRDELLPRAYEHAARLAACNPVLLRNTRHALVRPLRRAMSDDLHAGLALEAIASLSGREWWPLDDE